MVSTLLLVVSFAFFSPVWAVVESSMNSEQEWVLQLGYFANLANALAFKQQLTEAGFEAPAAETR